MIDLGAVSVYALANGCVFVTAACATLHLGFETPRLRWLSIGLVASATIVGLELVLGIGGLLSSTNLLLAAVMLAVTAVWLARRNGSVLRGIDALVSDVDGVPRVLFQSRFSTVVTLLAAAAGVLVIGAVFFFPPLSWDGLAYHLPPVMDFMHEERITFVGYSVFADAYPNTTELHFLWNVVFLRDAVIVDGTQFAFAVVGALAAYALSREAGLESENALLAGVVFLLTPVVLLQSLTTYVDVAFGAMILAGYVFLVRYWQDPAWRHVLLLGVAGGLLVGIKFTGGLFVLLLGGAIFLAWAGAGDDRRPRTAVAHTFVFGLLASILGGYWYLRNWLHFGNPVYPFEIDVLGVQVFEGTWSVQEKVLNAWSKASDVHGSFAATSPVEKLSLSWFDRVRQFGLGGPIGSYGPQLAVLAVPASLFLLADSLRRQDRIRLFILALFVLPLFVVVEPWKARYNVFVLGAVGLAIGFARQAVAVRTRSILSGLVVGLLVLSLVMSSGVWPWALAVVDEGAAMPADDRTSMNLRENRAPLTWETYVRVIPDGSRVGHVLERSHLLYTLYDGRLDLRMRYLGDTTSPDVFEGRMLGEDLDYLILAKGSDQHSWATGFETLSPVHTNKQYTVFEVSDG